MEDYFLIILTLIIAVVGAFNRKKKKNAPAPAETDGDKQPSSFWDMIMDEQGLTDEPVGPYVDDEPEFEEEQPVVQQYKAPVPKQGYSFSAESEGKSEIKEEMKKLEKKKRHVFIDGEKFSLKKAVIYSEILNRKYS